MGKKKSNPIPNRKPDFSSFTSYLTEDNLTPHLLIPSDFVKNQVANLFQNAFLVNEYSGKSWIVKIEKIRNNHFFTIGWKKFAQDFDLINGDFVLFKLVGKSRFNVSVYDGRNECLKKLCSGEEQSRSVDADEEEEGNSKIWKLELTKEHASQLEVPKDLAMDSGVARNREVKLVDEKGREWRVQVTTKKNGKFYMTVGWNRFLVGNKVVTGSTILFDFVGGRSGNVIKTKLLKNEKCGELFCSANRGRGRPPKLNLS